MKNSEAGDHDLYLIKHPVRVGWFCGIVVVFGTNRIGLVDTGFENTPTDYIFPLVQEKGRRLEEINCVVNTHRDGDHVGGHAIIKEKTGATIAIHTLEAEAIKSADVRLTGGDVIELGDRQFQVIHTPGHQPGSICLYDAETCLLITGDTVCGDRADLIRMDGSRFILNKELWINSLKQLLNLDIQFMIMSHPFKPVGKSILIGTEPTTMIQACIDIALKLK